jgi:hypothetical protein
MDQSMRAFLLSLFLLGLLAAQPLVLKEVTVQSGSVADVALPVPLPQSGDVFDILSSYTDAQITIVTPDGKVVTLGAAQEGPVLEAISAEEIHEIGTGLKNVLVPGPGQHWLLGVGDKPQAGTYHVRVDGSQARARFRVAIAPINIADALKGALRKISGARIFDAVKVPAGSKGSSIPFSLTRGSRGVLIDVVAADSRALIRLRLPDGTAVTRENAKDHGIEWDLEQWPPVAGGDDFGFGAMFMMLTMLPIRGTHHSISLGKGPLPPGRYAIEAVAAGDHPTQVSAMIISLPDLEKQISTDLDNFGLKPGETRAMGNGYSGPTAFVRDKIPLAIRLHGEPVRQPPQFHTHAVLTRVGEPPKNLDLPLDFVYGSDGFYRGIFVPEEAGTYTLTIEVTGRQKSGRVFGATAGLDSVDVHPLVAKLTGLSERAPSSNGTGSPDQLEVTASVEVFDPGTYEFTMVLSDNKIAQLSESRRMILDRGAQQISASIRAARISSIFEADGPYRASISLDRVTDGGTKFPADVRAGKEVITAAYRLQDWQPAGTGLDLKGDGKFQIYRVPWEVVTTGGDCSWTGNFSPLGSSKVMQFIAGRARLAPGMVTLDLDLDGYWIKRSGNAYAWWAAMDMRCDGKSVDFSRDPSRFMLRTPVLRPEDFEPRPADFRMTTSEATVRLRAGGQQRIVPVDIETIGELEDPVKLQYAGPGILRASAQDIPAVQPLKRRGYVSLWAATEAQPGEYPIQVTASAAGVQHAVALRVIVDGPSAPPAPSSPREPGRVGVRVARRRSVALVVGMNGTMNSLGCDAIKPIVRDFSARLQPGLDELSVIDVGALINVSIPMTVDFNDALPKLMDRLAQIRCGGTSNMAYAIEKAEEQLSAEDLRSTERSVVLLIAGPPTALTAKWPVRTQADSRMQADSQTQPALFGKLQGEAVVPPSGCPDTQGHRYPDPDWATGDSMPDRTGVLRFTDAGQIIGPLGPPEGTPAAVLPAAAPVDNACAFASAVFPYVPMHRDLAYVPDTDVAGVPFEGAEPLVRFEQGPYRGKIRPDLPENIFAIQRNLLPNALQRLNKAGIRAVLVWINPFADPVGLESALNLPGANSFDASRPSGAMITIHHEDQIPRAIEQMLAAISGGK